MYSVQGLWTDKNGGGVARTLDEAHTTPCWLHSGAWRGGDQDGSWCSVIQKRQTSRVLDHMLGYLHRSFRFSNPLDLNRVFMKSALFKWPWNYSFYYRSKWVWIACVWIIEFKYFVHILSSSTTHVPPTSALFFFLVKPNQISLKGLSAAWLGQNIMDWPNITCGHAYLMSIENVE